MSLDGDERRGSSKGIFAIEDAYRQRTPGSERLMGRASRSMPRGVTRGLSWYAPYPVVFERGVGSWLYDVDGNAYIDLVQNGLSLIHGHGYEPIDRALRAALERGTAWQGASDAQIEFAELLRDRIPTTDMVRFANTGTEATMLAVKLARAATGRQLILKAWDAYHGSYDDLEAGLHGNAEIPGRTALARFGDLKSFAEVFDRHAGEIAALILEPVLYTGVVIPPPPGFLVGVEALAREADALVILDDCLMFRLAEGGSAERFGLTPDITCLGKWIGGGLPIGAVGASEAMMSHFDPMGDAPIYHGGSFNGNLLGSVAGTIAVRDLTADPIARMNAQADRLRAALGSAAAEAGLPLSVPGEGSAFGIHVLGDGNAEIDWDASSQLHLAALNHGVAYGPGGECGLWAGMDENEIDAIVDGFKAAFHDIAKWRRQSDQALGTGASK